MSLTMRSEAGVILLVATVVSAMVVISKWPL